MEEILNKFVSEINKLRTFIEKLPMFQKYDNLDHEVHTYDSSNPSRNIITVPAKTFHALSIGVTEIDSTSEIEASYTLQINPNTKVGLYKQNHIISLSSLNINEIVITINANTSLSIIKQF